MGRKPPILPDVASPNHIPPDVREAEAHAMARPVSYLGAIFFKQLRRRRML